MNARRQDAEALNEAGFAARLAALPDPGAHVAAAVSGGPDSMALALLLADWCRTRGRRLSALVVDHGLRAESATEAGLVAARLAALGVETVSLAWRGRKPAHGIQAAAREARYRLMTDWCRGHGVASLFLGHHADDQAATVAMRVLHGSGIDGLAGMRPVRWESGVRLYRPLLDVAKRELVTWLEGRGVPWVSDPGNEREDFERNRVDRWLESLDDDGTAVRRLARLGRRAARAADALTRMADRTFERLVRADRFGTLRADWDGFAAEEPELRLRLLRRLAASAGAHDPGLGATEEALARLEANGTASVGRAVLRRRRGDLVAVREARRLPSVSWPAGERVVQWDGRFRLEAPTPPAMALAVAPLRGMPPELKRRAAVPERPPAATLPALYCADRLVAVPHFDWRDAAGEDLPAISVAVVGHDMASH